VILLTVLITATKTVHTKEESYKEKWRQFECGFTPLNPPHIPFSFQFFLVALLFLIFDIEISLLISYPMEVKDRINITMLSGFIWFLTIGLIYEWEKGKIDWIKWMEPKRLIFARLKSTE
jgi:NADH:ubiquinone oxidoreductase subunit 3 (subunit A)